MNEHTLGEKIKVNSLKNDKKMSDDQIRHLQDKVKKLKYVVFMYLKDSLYF